jgi:hypothetical protein
MAVPEPTYAVTLREGDFEIRDYPPEIVAQVTVSGDQDAAANAGFRLLAGYIFGANTRRQSIAMTAPVVQSRDGGEKIPMTAPVTQTVRDGAWTVRFIMPPQYTLDTLPTPKDSRVTLAAQPAARVAVVRFSGLAYEHDVQARTDELYAFIAAHHWRAIGPPTLARYNPPWTPWFMRRNEVMVPLDVAAPPK